MVNKAISYSLARNFYGINIPLPVQSTYLRTYFEANQLKFRLPIVEITQNNSYYMLGRAINHLDQDDIVVMTSILILPHYDQERIKTLLVPNIYENFFHFPLEGLILNGLDLVKWSKDFSVYCNVSTNKVW